MEPALLSQEKKIEYLPFCLVPTAAMITGTEFNALFITGI